MTKKQNIKQKRKKKEGISPKQTGPASLSRILSSLTLTNTRTTMKPTAMKYIKNQETTSGLLSVFPTNAVMT